MDAQPRITDLIPKKLGTIALLTLLGLMLIVGLEALYYWMPTLARHATDGRVAALDLDSEGSLGAFFSSLLLGLSGLAALLIWSLRRHRVDDYHGRYRIWLWAFAVWSLMCLDESCSLHEGFKEMMSHGTGQRLYGDGSLWWVMAYSLVLGALGLRLVMEMRACRGSIAVLALTAVFWFVAVAAQLGWLLPESGARGVMLEEACEMLGHLCLLLSMCLHARYVIQDVQGMHAASTAAPKKRRKKAATNSVETEEAASQHDNAKAATAQRGKRDQTPASAPAIAQQEAASPAKPLDTKSQNRPASEAKAPEARHGSSNVKPLDTTARPTATPAAPKAEVRSPDRPVESKRVDPPESPSPNRKLSKAERRAMRRQHRDEDDEA